MIDVWGVFTNALWIFGAAIILAACSFAYYESQVEGKRFLEYFSEPNYDLSFTVGLALVIAGLALTDSRIWVQIIWITFGVLVLYLYFRRRQAGRQDG